jgi:hypothetical protein
MGTSQLRRSIRPVAPVLDDGDDIDGFLAANSPYPTLMSLFAPSSRAEGALSGTSADRAASPRTTAPGFRGVWARDGRPANPAGAAFLSNQRLADAARTIFAGAIVRPDSVFVNLTAPMPLRDLGHTDVPAFRGVTRDNAPEWLLIHMARSGLFDRWRMRIATAVSWFYEGEAGGFTFWPDGPDAPPVSIRPPRNSALVTDADMLFHRVDGVGGPEDHTLDTIDLGALLVLDEPGASWLVRDGDRVVSRYHYGAVRVSVSWKAYVFADEAETAIVDDHRDDLTIDQVADVLVDDLAAKGHHLDPPVGPTDAAFQAAVVGAYGVSPRQPGEVAA